MEAGFLHKAIAKASRGPGLGSIRGGQRAVYGVVASVNPKTKSVMTVRHSPYL